MSDTSLDKNGSVVGPRTPQSYNEMRNVLVKAIQHRAHRELGLREARRAINVDRNLKLRGLVFEKVVLAGDSYRIGTIRLCRMAEALGLDPIEVFGRAAQERRAS